MNNSIEINFWEEKEVIDPDLLGQFLLEFNDIYRVACVVVGDVSPEQFIKDKEKYIEEVKSKLRNIDAYSSKPGFECIKISFNSPLSIWVMGIISALALAVIVSGGEVEVFGAKFKINSLGSGLEAINNALHANPRLESDRSTVHNNLRAYLRKTRGENNSRLNNDDEENNA